MSDCPICIERTRMCFFVDPGPCPVCGDPFGDSVVQSRQLKRLTHKSSLDSLKPLKTTTWSFAELANDANEAYRKVAASVVQIGQHEEPPTGGVMIPDGSLLGSFDGKVRLLRPGQIVWEDLSTDADPEPDHIVKAE